MENKFVPPDFAAKKNAHLIYLLSSSATLRWSIAGKSPTLANQNFTEPEQKIALIVTQLTSPDSADSQDHAPACLLSHADLAC
jgi:hypothetical protein